MQVSQQDINNNMTVAKCKICGGQGSIIVKAGKGIPTKNPNRIIHYSEAVLCICRKNELVELGSPYFNPVRTPFVSEDVALGMSKVFDIKKDYLFTGDQQDFLKICKSIFVHYRQDSRMLMHISNGLEVVTEYYVEQAAGIERRFHDLIRNRDLVVLIFNTQVSNKAVAPCMVELLQGRFLAGKATWIWAPEDMSAVAEYSEELMPILAKFHPRKVQMPGKR